MQKRRKDIKKTLDGKKSKKMRRKDGKKIKENYDEQMKGNKRKAMGDKHIFCYLQQLERLKGITKRGKKRAP